MKSPLIIAILFLTTTTYLANTKPVFNEDKNYLQGYDIYNHIETNAGWENTDNSAEITLGDAEIEAYAVSSSNQFETESYFLPNQLPGDMSNQQISTTLSLVSIAENGDTQWWNYYNYIENINDGRGYTISLVGFCTGTGDFIQVLQELQKINPHHILVKYIPLLVDRDGGDVSGLEGLPNDVTSIGNNDAQFNTAVWIIIRRLYWDPAIKFCQSHGLNSALAKYIAYDTILNFGDLDHFRRLVNRAGEPDFLKRFLIIKQKVIESDGSLGDANNNRVGMQNRLLAQGNFALRLPIYTSCYGDDYVLN